MEQAKVFENKAFIPSNNSTGNSVLDDINDLLESQKLNNIDTTSKEENQFSVESVSNKIGGDHMLISSLDASSDSFYIYDEGFRNIEKLMEKVKENAKDLAYFMDYLKHIKDNFQAFMNTNIQK